MAEESNRSPELDLDRATADRLAKLRSAPVDMTALNAWAQREASRPGDRHTYASPWKIGGSPGLRPSRIAIAASLLLVAGVIFLLLAQPRPAMASPADLALVHADMIAGRLDVSPVDSIDAANRLLAAEHPSAPTLPMVKCDRLMSCCMRRVHETSDKKMSCLLFSSGGARVTLAVARSRDLRPPKSAGEVAREGRVYRTQSSGSVNMVMTEADGRWVCLMGEAPESQLLELAGSLKF